MSPKERKETEGSLVSDRVMSRQLGSSQISDIDCWKRIKQFSVLMQFLDMVSFYFCSDQGALLLYFPTLLNFETFKLSVMISVILYVTLPWASSFNNSNNLL